MNAIILSIGDELALGQTVDTNSAWMSAQLAAAGCGVRGHVTVADDQPAIEDAIRFCAARADVLLISGGIGPTEDDLTRQALAAVLGAPLEVNDVWMGKLLEFFAARGRAMPEANRAQAMVPRGAAMIDNPNGTACGVRATIPGAGGGHACEVFAVPGVPKEMKAMFAADVMPHVRRSAGGAAIVSRTLHTFGLGESWVAERIPELMRRGRNPSVGTTVSGGIVSLRLNSRFGSVEEATSRLADTEAACRAALGPVLFGQGDQTLQQVVAGLLLANEDRVTVATAESCTGGLLAKMLTDVPGSSRYFKTGFVTYANDAKYERLGVSTEVLNVYGAVSENVVTAMANNARRLAKATYALAVSGVAGPGGGSETKPVGTVCIALATPIPGGGPGRFAESEVTARTFNFPGDREMIRDRSAKMALALLRFKLLGIETPF